MTSDRDRFELYAEQYTATVQSAISASGETVQFFADLKARITRGATDGTDPATILDFGCGIGNSTRALQREFTDGTIVGYDSSAASVEIARSHETAERVTFVSSPEPPLPFADASYDLAFTACVLHHIPASQRATWLHELRRVLKPGAPLFVFEHNPYNPLTRRVVRDCPFDDGVDLLRPNAAARLLRSCGFRVARPRFYFFFPHALRGLRPAEPYLDWLPGGGQYYVVGLA